MIDEALDVNAEGLNSRVAKRSISIEPGAGTQAHPKSMRTLQSRIIPLEDSVSGYIESGSENGINRPSSTHDGASPVRQRTTQ